MKINNNLPDALRRLRQIEQELLDLIPVCTSDQLIKCEYAMNICLAEKRKLQKMQDIFIDDILSKL